MNKTAIKNFAVWARRKLINEITYKAGLIGINEKGILQPLPISTGNIQFFDIGTGKPNEIFDDEIKQRNALVKRIREKESTSDYKTAFQFVIEEVAYTWFNRLIAIRFMEVNDYLPSRIRVLSSETPAKSEPDMVTAPFDTDMEFSPFETDQIMQLKHENKLDELFRMLFIKQCNKLNEVLPELFEKTADYTELLLTISFTDNDGIVSHLVNDIAEEDFTEAVEIIGWMYQYYNTEPKDEVFALLKKKVKITKERIPAATQIFTPDWIVRYMVENSLGRLWVEGHPNDDLKAEWRYYLEEAEQEESVSAELEKMRTGYQILNPEDIRVMDPCMGSGHILVYAFDVLMQIYERQGYTQRDAAKSIIENNLYGLDIDERAAQLTYFSVMMKARQYDRRFLSHKVQPHVYAITESNHLDPFCVEYFVNGNAKLKMEMQTLINDMDDAKEYGSILNITNVDFDAMYARFDEIKDEASIYLEIVFNDLLPFIQAAQAMAQKYDVVVTNPPYMGSSGMGSNLLEYVKENYPDTKSDLFSCFIEKGFSFAKSTGFVAMITMESWMFLSSFEKMREKIIGTKNIRNLVHMPYLGKGGTSLGINFGTAAVVFDNRKISKYNAQYDYVRYFETNDEGIPFSFPTVNERYKTASLDDFSKISGSPIAYWVSEISLKAFEHGIPLKEILKPKQGTSTGDDEQYVRFWHEVNYKNSCFNCKNLKQAFESKKRYFPLDKGGAYRKWYGNNEKVIKMDKTSYNELLMLGNHLPSRELYFLKGLTWSKITSGKFSIRYDDFGHVFSSVGLKGFPDNNYINNVLGFMNSKVAEYYLEAISPGMSTVSGDLEKLPYYINYQEKENVNLIVENSVQIAKYDWDYFEISWDFSAHPLVSLKSKGNSVINYSNAQYRIKDIYKDWEYQTGQDFIKLKANEEKLNQIFIDLYGLQDELTSEVEDKYITVRKADLQVDIKSLLSYAVGCMFGRYSIDVDGLAYAGGDWNDSKYTTFIPDKDNCILITDEEYFEDDIVGQFVEFVKCVYGVETLEENLDFIARALGNKGDTSREIIRNYFVKDFYKDHVKTYQKRPIYWLYDSGKQDGFKALVYMHRYTADTTGIVRVDYLHKMQKIYMSEIDRMIDTEENSNNAREIAQAEKRKEKLVKQLKETKEYDEKIAHLAISRIAIDLDDGVKVNYEKVQTGQDGKKLGIFGKI